MINRSALVLTAKQPFLDWLQSLPDPGEAETTLEDVNRERTTHLLPDYDMLDEEEQLLERFYDIIFEMELEGWWTDESHWPADRDLSLFKQWFHYEFHSVVVDLVDGPLIDDE